MQHDNGVHPTGEEQEGVIASQKFVYYAGGRKRIREGDCNPADTRAYIEALENIARAAMKLYESPDGSNAVYTLYDALEHVDWMRDDV